MVNKEEKNNEEKNNEEKNNEERNNKDKFMFIYCKYIKHYANNLASSLI